MENKEKSGIFRLKSWKRDHHLYRKVNEVNEIFDKTAQFHRQKLAQCGNIASIVGKCLYDMQVFFRDKMLVQMINFHYSRSRRCS